MKVIVAGSRGITDRKYIVDCIEHSQFPITTLVHGNARGVDQIAGRWAYEVELPVEVYPAEWEKFGKSAGYKRNVLMAEHADALIAIWDGKSKGTEHMINIAKRAGLEVEIRKPK